MRLSRLLALALILTVAFAIGAAADTVPTIERGYLLMYSLQFDEADRDFADVAVLDPSDPLVPASRAANLLFREFDRLNILQTALFRDNSTFASPAAAQPDARVRTRFDALLAQASRLALDRLARQPRDVNALFASTLVEGLHADYASLVEHRNMAALSYTRAADKSANALLAVAPHYYDAYLATGISAYIVGSLPAPLRWVLRLGGYSGDRERGVKQLALTAERGRLLAPFARILLAVVSLRENDNARARTLLAGLARDFPSNPLFARELHRLGAN